MRAGACELTSHVTPGWSYGSLSAGSVSKGMVCIPEPVLVHPNIDPRKRALDPGSRIFHAPLHLGDCFGGSH
jgi:hydroxyacyl-ACP dehydratase HTD2-like protein with hotdog domain